MHHYINEETTHVIRTSGARLRDTLYYPVIETILVSGPSVLDGRTENSVATILLPFLHLLHSPSSSNYSTSRGDHHHLLPLSTTALGPSTRYDRAVRDSYQTSPPLFDPTESVIRSKLGGFYTDDGRTS